MMYKPILIMALSIMPIKSKYKLVINILQITMVLTLKSMNIFPTPSKLIHPSNQNRMANKMSPDTNLLNMNKTSMKLQDMKPLPDMKAIIDMNPLNIKLQDTKHHDTNPQNNNISHIKHHNILIIAIIKCKLIISQFNIFKLTFINHSQFIMYHLLSQ